MLARFATFYNFVINKKHFEETVMRNIADEW